MIRLLSLKKIFNFANYLAITPLYDFQKRNLVKSCSFKCYVIVVGILSVTGESWSMWYRSQIIQTLRTSVRVVDVINEMTLFGTYLAIKLHLCFLKDKEWNNLFNLMNYLDDNLRSKGDDNLIKKFVTGQIIIGNVFFCIFTVYQWVSLINTENITLDFSATYIIHYFSYYNNVFITIIMNVIILTFLTKFKMLNNYFKEKFLLTRKDTTRLASTSKCVSIVRQVENYFRILSETVDVFNSLFGFIVLLEFLHFVVNIIAMINISFLSSSLGPQKVDLSSINVLVSNTLATCFAVIWNIIFAFLCQKVVDEARHTVNLCCTFQGQVPARSEEREELLNLATMAEMRRPVFTAAGFFEISRSFLMGIFGTISTYVIVLIQINMAMY